MLHQMQYYVSDSATPSALLHSTKSHIASRAYRELLSPTLQSECDVLETSYDALPRCSDTLRAIYTKYRNVVIMADISMRGHGQLIRSMRIAQEAGVAAQVLLEEKLLSAFAQNGTLNKISIPSTLTTDDDDYLLSSELATAFGTTSRCLVANRLDVDIESVFFRPNHIAAQDRLNSIIGIK